MRNLKLLTIITLLLLTTSCKKNYVYNDTPTNDTFIANSTIRSYDEALQIAEKALIILDGNHTRSEKKRTIKRDKGQIIYHSITRNDDDCNNPVMYIFNNEDNEGFTIVSADRSQQALIAVTQKGSYTFGTPTGVEPFDLYIENVTSQLMSSFEPATLPDQPLIPIPGYKIDTADYNYSKVDAMLTTKWGQSGIYGDLCPNGLSGCTNTAAVQIMAYHKQPYNLPITYLGANSYTLSIDWDNILLHTTGSGRKDSTLDKYVCNCGCNYDQISIIMREIGSRANTEYEFDNPNTPENERGSRADELAIRNVLYDLGFGNPVHVEGIVLEDYKNVIFENLNKNRPIYVSGFQVDNTGHAWVIDGYEHTSFRVDYYKADPNYNNINEEPVYTYDFSSNIETNLLHFNWGWNGDCDGWFTYGCFDTKKGVDYDNGSDENFNFINWINLVYNIQPN